MKRITKIFGLLFVLCMALIVSCAGGAETANTETPASDGRIASTLNETMGQRSSEVSVIALNDVEGKEWILTELRSAGTTVRIDRAKLEADNMGGWFTLSFQEDRVSGVGAPNRYFGTFKANSESALSFSEPLGSTMMAAFRELDELKEHEYFTYLSKVTRWALRDGKLELYSTSDGIETTLVFEVK